MIRDIKKKEEKYYPEPLQGRYHASLFFTQESFESGFYIINIYREHPL
jgi:hypothetical protein